MFVAVNFFYLPHARQTVNTERDSMVVSTLMQPFKLDPAKVATEEADIVTVVQR